MFLALRTEDMPRALAESQNTIAYKGMLHIRSKIPTWIDRPKSITSRSPRYTKTTITKQPPANIRIMDSSDIEGGAALFQENCAACHGENAGGMREIGAPNLTNNIWLYGSDRASIVEGIENGRGGIMPHFGERLDDVTVKALTVYVHSLGGGE
jgi:mono/diheme cytochrome c family protein